MIHILFLVIALCALSGHPEKYKALISLKHARCNKVVEVFLLPPALTVPKPSDSRRLDIEHYEIPTQAPDVDDVDRLHSDRRQVSNNNFEPSYAGDYDNGDRIVDGVDVDISMFPYHVGYGINCGGAIIGSKWILTAAHCGKKMSIRSGSKYLNRGKQTRILQYHLHPLWLGKKKEHPFDYDFQILELDEELNFDENTQRIKVARMSHIVVGKKVTVTGWGHTKESGSYSSILQAVNVPIIDNEVCRKVPYPYSQGRLTPRMFCAGYSDGTKDACQGDSGGPAVANDHLIGMVSFGFGCATPEFYGVYSNVAKVRDWIKNIVRDNID